MALTPQNIEEKPYNACLNCVHIGKNCDGPNFLTMTGERWCEWCRLRKEYLGWTNAYVAERSGVSKVTVDRVMSVSIKDMRITTVQAITKALVNGSWGQYPCAMPDLNESNTVYVDNPELIAKLEAAEKDLAATKEDCQEHIEFLKKQISVKDYRLEEYEKRLAERYAFLTRKDKIMWIFSALLAISVLINIVLVLIN